MIQIRKAEDRGRANFGWLDSSHSFSFGQYFDPDHMGFRVLRVINEDVVSPSNGFGTHPHANAEIISYVLEGQLEHKDSMGNGSIINAGELQRITAGTGITHSEFNPSDVAPAHFYQIWLEPKVQNVEPSYQQEDFRNSLAANELTLVASPDGSEGSLRINQDAKIYLAKLEHGEQVTYPISKGRHAWLQIIKGTVEVNGAVLNTSDGAAISEIDMLTFEAIENAEHKSAEIMLFDLP